MRKIFARTQNVKNFINLMNNLQNRGEGVPGMALVYGEPGLGKQEIKHNLNKIRFHDLRHTHASVLLSKGASIKYVQERLGHSDCKMTLNTYTHVMSSQKEKALTILDDILKNEQKMSMKNEKA